MTPSLTWRRRWKRIRIMRINAASSSTWARAVWDHHQQQQDLALRLLFPLASHSVLIVQAMCGLSLAQAAQIWKGWISVSLGDKFGDQIQCKMNSSCYVIFSRATGWSLSLFLYTLYLRLGFKFQRQWLPQRLCLLVTSLLSYTPLAKLIWVSGESTFWRIGKRWQHSILIFYDKKFYLPHIFLLLTFYTVDASWQGSTCK